MLWYCRYKWHPTTTYAKVAQRVVEQHDAGMNLPDRIRGWYDLAGGGAGFLLIETDDPSELSIILQPYLDLVDVDVHCVMENNYDETIDRLRQVAQQAP